MEQPDPSNWHFVGLMFTVTFSTLQSRIGSSAPLWLILSSLPGTIAHELAHYIIAFVCGGRPTGFTVVPRRSTGGEGGRSVAHWTLGSVTLRRVSFLSAFPSGFAPLLLNGAAWQLYRHWFSWFPRDLWHTVGLYLVISILCASSVPSFQDVRVAFSSTIGAVVYVTLIISGYLYREQLAELARLVTGG